MLLHTATVRVYLLRSARRRALCAQSDALRRRYSAYAVVFYADFRRASAMDVSACRRYACFAMIIDFHAISPLTRCLADTLDFSVTPRCFAMLRHTLRCRHYIRYFIHTRLCHCAAAMLRAAKKACYHDCLPRYAVFRHTPCHARRAALFATGTHILCCCCHCFIRLIATADACQDTPALTPPLPFAMSALRALQTDDARYVCSAEARCALCAAAAHD